jgi:methionyl-tRNA formyltransferase
MAYPLMLGDEKTGITIIQLDDKLDHGPILDQEEMRISLEDKRPDLEKKLTDLAYTTFKEKVQLAVSGNLLPAVAQENEEATYTRMMKNVDGFIPVETLKKYLENKEISDEEQPLILREYLQKFPHNSRKTASSLLLYNLYRGLFPWPGIWTQIHVKGEGKRLKITKIRYENDHVVIEKVQLEGKKEVDFATFLKAYKLQ